MRQTVKVSILPKITHPGYDPANPIMVICSAKQPFTLLNIGVDADGVFVWCLCDSTKPLMQRKFWIVLDLEPMQTSAKTYIGTIGAWVTAAAPALGIEAESLHVWTE